MNTHIHTYICAQVQIQAFSAGIKVIHTCVKKDAFISFTAKRLLSHFKCARSDDLPACSTVQWTQAWQNIAFIRSLFL